MIAYYPSCEAYDFSSSTSFVCDSCHGRTYSSDYEFRGPCFLCSQLKAAEERGRSKAAFDAGMQIGDHEARIKQLEEKSRG